MKSLMMILSLVFALTAATAFAENLADNPDYQTGMQLYKLGEEAYANGDYDNAATYWAQADEYFKKVNPASDGDQLKSQAEALLKTLNERFAKLDTVRAGKEYPDQLTTATTNHENAKQSFSSEDYQTSINEAEVALAALDEIDALLAQGDAATTTDETIVLPRYYVVRLVPGNRDCLWNIAAYPFVYNDPMKWRILYDANKKLLVTPSDPDLIHLRQVFEIPSIAGEKREGTYDPAKQYPALPKKKK